jgi:glyoxylase-like metal-dependent hydrolase (beta-lactamase superfamily II)
MPMDYKDYHPDWKAISKRIRERDGQKCVQCGVSNGAVGFRDSAGFHEVYNINDEASLEVDVICDYLEDQGKKLIRIILTVAHLDHDSGNNSESNLSSLCQKCHLTLDADQHRTNAAATRLKKKIATGQIQMLDLSEIGAKK